MVSELRTAFWNYDRTLPLIDGSVRAEGCTLAIEVHRPELIFSRAFSNAEFDLCELSLSNVITALSKGEFPYVLLPVFLARTFRHSSIIIRVDRGIRQPQDLRGKTVGLQEYGMTAAVVIRGFLRDYGVDPRDIRWRVGEKGGVRANRHVLEAQIRWSEKRRAAGRKKPGKKAKPRRGEPDGKAQRNFTDPESRIMKTRDGFVQAYNAQAAVDGKAQVIVAHGLTNSQSDQDQLAPRLDDIEAHLGRRPKAASADSGYCSEANLAALEQRDIEGYVAVARAKHPAAAKRQPLGPLTQAMQRKLKRGGWRSRYRFRKQIVEPVFGQIKAARGFRQFLMRGIEKVRAEWAMICAAHNLVKLARAVA